MDYAKEIGQLDIRHSWFIDTLTKRLKPIRGLPGWLTIQLVAAVGFVGFGQLNSDYWEFAALVCGIVLSYTVALHNFSASLCSFYILFGGKAAEERIYPVIIGKMFTFFSAVILPALLVISLTILNIKNHTLAHQIFGFIALTSIIIFILNQVPTTSVFITDYLRLIAAAAGRKTNIVTTREMTSELMKQIIKCKLLPQQTDALLKLAEVDVRHAETKVELLNISLALIAISISILFSEKIIGGVIIAFEVVDRALFVLSQAASDLLTVTTSLKHIVMTFLYVGLWWQVANLIISIIYVGLRALLTPYLSNLRPAYALFQALALNLSAPPEEAKINDKYRVRHISWLKKYLIGRG